MTSLAAFLAGALLIAIGLAWAIGPVKLLAGVVVVPILAAAIAVAGGVGWIVLRWHGAAP